MYPPTPQLPFPLQRHVLGPKSPKSTGSQSQVVPLTLNSPIFSPSPRLDSTQSPSSQLDGHNPVKTTSRSWGFSSRSPRQFSRRPSRQDCSSYFWGYPQRPAPPFRVRARCGIFNPSFDHRRGVSSCFVSTGQRPHAYSCRLHIAANRPDRARPSLRRQKGHGMINKLHTVRY
jgi:hypothetical protein